MAVTKKCDYIAVNQKKDFNGDYNENQFNAKPIHFIQESAMTLYFSEALWKQKYCSTKAIKNYL